MSQNFIQIFIYLISEQALLVVNKILAPLVFGPGSGNVVHAYHSQPMNKICKREKIVPNLKLGEVNFFLSIFVKMIILSRYFDFN